MTRWTPLSIYLTALCYTTGIVILAGTFAVQAWSEWPTIRGTGTLQPTPHESPKTHRAVKPAHHLANTQKEKKGLEPIGSANVSAGVTLGRVRDFAYSSSVTGREWTPSRGTLRSDWDREPRLSKHGVRRVPAREPSSLRFTETGRGPLAPWRPDLIAAHHLCGVDIPLLASLVGRESGWDPWALSKAGARGLTQVLPSTAAEFAPGMNLWNPAENLIVGGCWLRKLIDDYRGDVRTALHAYHAGGGTVRRKQVKQVTRDYANDVILGSAN